MSEWELRYYRDESRTKPEDCIDYLINREAYKVKAIYDSKAAAKAAFEKVGTAIECRPERTAVNFYSISGYMLVEVDTIDETYEELSYSYGDVLDVEYERELDEYVSEIKDGLECIARLDPVKVGQETIDCDASLSEDIKNTVEYIMKNKHCDREAAEKMLIERMRK